jgi:hypothetical protein
MTALMAYKFVRLFHRGGYGAVVVAASREQAAERLRLYTEQNDLGDTSWVDDADVTELPVDRASVLMWTAS